MNVMIRKDSQQQFLASRNAQGVYCHGCRRIISSCHNQEKCSQQNVKISERESSYGDFSSISQCFAITSMPSPRGRRAFLCGVSYKGQKLEVRGALQDVKSVRNLLVERFNFPATSILLLAEEDPYKLPTKKNVQEAFQWLTADLQAGDSLVFYFSGHGKRHRDFSKDKIVEFVEAICPVDFETQGMICDKEINETIVRSLKEGVILHSIIDACHSGSMLDLPYVYNKDKGKWDGNSPQSGSEKGTNKGRAICFSACEDYQLAIDTSAFTPGKNMTGVMTHTFIKAMEANQTVTYSSILCYMHDAIEEANKERDTCCRIFKGFNHKISQDPQLSSSEEFDINSEFKL